MTALDDIAAERHRQISQEGWTPEHDDEHDTGEMSDAAAAYALRPVLRNILVGSYTMDRIIDRIWPWSREWWKPGDRRRDLVKAGALIVAEIDRLDRTNPVTPAVRVKP